MTPSRHTLVVVLPLLIGGALLGATLLVTDFDSVRDLAVRAGLGLPLILLPGAVWHAVRATAWRECFPADLRPSFGRLWRVRLAAEAFSFVTIRGVGGEPLKVALLDREVPPAVAAAAVALERIVYVMTTATIVAIAAAVAIATLPLTPAWTRVFGAVGGCAAAFVAAALWLLLRRAPRQPGSPSTPTRRSPLARFARALDEQVKRVAHEDPRRLLALVALQSLAYVMMALEAWTVFRLIDIPVTATGAFAVETLTRVASMASAFIPANLGALEASNVAAATAVHAAGGAAALALARRLRGLFWCAAGFLIYPRRRATAARVEGDVLVVLEDAGAHLGISAHLGGMPIGERLLRAAARAGCTRVLVWAPRQQAGWEKIIRRTRLPLDITAVADLPAWQAQLATLSDRDVTVVAPGVVPSPPLLGAARDLAPSGAATIIEAPASATCQFSGVFRAVPQHLADPAVLAARMSNSRACVPPRDEPSDEDVAQGGALLSLLVTTPAGLARAERRLRRSVFKTTDGIFGRFNRRMSLPISVALIRSMRLSAHAMSMLLLAGGFYAGWLFSRGNYVDGVIAAVISWAASVLDGCDGELARLQYKDSAFGCWLDTLGDYAYYFSVFIGLTIGVARRDGGFAFWWIGASVLVGLVLTFSLLILLRGRITSGRPERLRHTAATHFHGTGKTWTAVVERLSMCATRATMPYGLLAFAVANVLPAFVVLAAIGAHVFWISLALQLKNLLNGARGLVAESSEPAY